MRRNATVTDRARLLADYIDAHSELGEVHTISAEDKRSGIGVSNRDYSALLFWFYRLDDTTVHAYGRTGGSSGNVSVRGRLGDIKVEVYASQPDAVVVNESAVTVHTLRRWQVTGAH